MNVGRDEESGWPRSTVYLSTGQGIGRAKNFDLGPKKGWNVGPPEGDPPKGTKAVFQDAPDKEAVGGSGEAKDAKSCRSCAHGEARTMLEEVRTGRGEHPTKTSRGEDAEDDRTSALAP